MEQRDILTSIIGGPPEGGGMPSILSPKKLAVMGSFDLTRYLCKSLIFNIPPSFCTSLIKLNPIEPL